MPVGQELQQPSLELVIATGQRRTSTTKFRIGHYDWPKKNFKNQVLNWSLLLAKEELNNQV